VIITGPKAGVIVTGRVGPANALFSIANGVTATVSRLGFVGSKTGVRNAGTFALTDGSLAASTTNLLNVSSGSVTLTNCRITGAATGIQNNGLLRVNLSTFSNNTTALVSVGTADVQTSTFASNGTGVLSNGHLHPSQLDAGWQHPRRAPPEQKRQHHPEHLRWQRGCGSWAPAVSRCL
jgi:hypothetical protein